MSLDAIRRLNRDEIKCTVLTKGRLPIELADCYEENEYGITLVSLVEAFRKRMEPHSAKLKDRLASLEALHNRGCHTWVSIEPYPTPNLVRQNLGTLLEAVAFTDKIIFGRTNYSTEVTAYTGQKEFYNDL
jgi:DNA repair photolyase